MRNLVFALFLFAAATSSGCAGPQVSIEDVKWPADKDLVAMHVPTQLPEHWDRAPFFPPVNDPLLPPFKDNEDVYIKGYNQNGVPTFAHQNDASREDLVWSLTHYNDSGQEIVDEMQIYSFPQGTIERLRRGDMPASEFAFSVYQKTDGLWHRLDHEQLVRRHVRWHFPRLATTPILKWFVTSEPTYVQAYAYPQNIPTGQRPPSGVMQPAPLSISSSR